MIEIVLRAPMADVIVRGVPASEAKPQTPPSRVVPVPGVQPPA